MQSLHGDFHPRTTDPEPTSDLVTCLCLGAGVDGCEETGETGTVRGRETRICIVPLQGRGPHSGEGPGVGSGEVRRGPCEHLRPYTSTDLLPWVIQKKHARHRPSPALLPLLRVRTS